MKALIAIFATLLFIIFIIIEYQAQENWIKLSNIKMERIAKIDNMEIWFINDKVVIKGVID
jgi:hypothetical protein